MSGKKSGSSGVRYLKTYIYNSCLYWYHADIAVKIDKRKYKYTSDNVTFPRTINATSDKLLM